MKFLKNENSLSENLIGTSYRNRLQNFINRKSNLIEVELEKEKHFRFVTVTKKIFSKQKLKCIYTHTITLSDICSGEDCKMKLPLNSIKYYCYWCNLTFCKTCGSNYDNYYQKIKVLPHKHNLILINELSSRYKKILTIDT